MAEFIIMWNEIVPKSVVIEADSREQAEQRWKDNQTEFYVDCENSDIAEVDLESVEVEEWSE